MIYHGDLFNVLPTLTAESIDSCATDPPYGIGVMGKEWDTFKPSNEAETLNQAIDSDNPNLKGRKRSPAVSPSAIKYDRALNGQRAFQAWTERWAREVYRVLKPGAHVLVCGAPRSFHRMTSGLEDAGFEVRDCLSWLYGQGFPKSLNLGKEDDAGFAKKWNGWGTALKPSWEPIVLARKPLIDTLAVNVHIFGTGALNIDACRVPSDQQHADKCASVVGCDSSRSKNVYGEWEGVREDSYSPLGRWPPNVLLDDESALLLDTQTGALKASRFMYVAKPSGSERDEGCDDLPSRLPTELTGRKEGSAGLKHARAGTDRKASNFHPTVKPVMLMQWLVTLITPPDGIVLDPFMGSGTTGMAARLADRKFIGIEREAEYVEIARRRISDTLALFYGEEEVR